MVSDSGILAIVMFFAVFALAISGAAQSPIATANVAPIVTEVVVAAPAARVWDAFTTTAGIQSWMVAAGDIDLRVGGRMRTSYRQGADLDGDTAIHQEILGVEPGRKFSYRTIKSPAGFPFAGAIATAGTVVVFEPLDAARTKVTVTMEGFTADAESQKMRAFFEVGNKATLDSLVKAFAAR